MKLSLVSGGGVVGCKLRSSGAYGRWALQVRRSTKRLGQQPKDTYGDEWKYFEMTTGVVEGVMGLPFIARDCVFFPRKAAQYPRHGPRRAVEPHRERHSSS